MTDRHAEARTPNLADAQAYVAAYCDTLGLDGIALMMAKTDPDAPSGFAAAASLPWYELPPGQQVQMLRSLRLCHLVQLAM